MLFRSCEVGSVKEIANAIEKLALDKDLRGRMGKRSRELGDERFDRRKTYSAIASLFEN